MGRKQKMPFRDAMELVPDDLPDGAYWAMAHDMAGLEYGDGFAELTEDKPAPKRRRRRRKKRTPLKTAEETTR